MKERVVATVTKIGSTATSKNRQCAKPQWEKCPSSWCPLDGFVTLANVASSQGSNRADRPDLLGLPEMYMVHDVSDQPQALEARNCHSGSLVAVLEHLNLRVRDTSRSLSTHVKQ
jgi:hypothetical protein